MFCFLYRICHVRAYNIRMSEPTFYHLVLVLCLCVFSVQPQSLWWNFSSHFCVVCIGFLRRGSRERYLLVYAWYNYSPAAFMLEDSFGWIQYLSLGLYLNILNALLHRFLLCCSWNLMLGFLLYINSLSTAAKQIAPKLSNLKQEAFVISCCLWVRN